MADASLGAVVRHLRQIVSPAADSRDDRALLDAFTERRDHTAFAVLLRRHGPMVLNVCRRVLRHEQDAEDAFQAAFLVLAMKAASLSIKTTVAGFLHGVAYRLALKARRQAMRRRRREVHAQTPPVASATAEPGWSEVQAVLEEEIQRLPEKYRLPFVLCHLEGLSRAEAGRQLRLKEGTVWSRLSQARALLQQRLSRRGIALSAVLAAVAVSETPVRAALVEAVVQGARQAVAGSLAGVASARVALLAQTALQTMTVKMKLALVGLAMLLTVGAGGVIHQALTAKPPETPAAPPQAKTAAKPKKPDAPRIHTDRHGDPLPDGALARLGTVRWQHGFFIMGLAYSPDGKKIAAVGGGRGITLWDAATGKELHPFSNRMPSLGVAFSPDGKLLATADHESWRLWDVASGKELRQLKVTGRLNAIAFAPDGKTLATVGRDGAARLWDADTGEERRRIACGQGVLFTVAFAVDGKRLASGGYDGTVRLWDAITGEEQRRLTGHKKFIRSVVFSPDGKLLASASDDALRLWDATTGRPAREFGAKQGSFATLAMSPDGALLASSDADGTIVLWDVATGTETRHWRSGARAAQSLAFSPDGKTLASNTIYDGSIRLWDVATGRERHPREGHHGNVGTLRFAADNGTLISIGLDQQMLRWDLATQTPRQRFSWKTYSAGRVALSPDGNALAASDYGKTNEVRLWDVRTGKPGRVLDKARKDLWAITFSPDGRLVAAAGDERVIHIWDVREGKEVQQIEGFDHRVMTLCFSPDSKALACGADPMGDAGGEPTLRLWDVNSDKELCSFARRACVGSLAFSPDGKMLASGDGFWAGRSDLGGSSKASVRLWDTTTGKELCRHNMSGSSEVHAVAFSPDGKLIASGGAGENDSSVHVWEAATGRLIRRFQGHHSWVYAVTFAADGLTVASGAGDSTILLWDITGRRADGRWHGKALTPRELDACWTALTDEDAAKAYDAVWALVASAEQAVPFLAKHLRPVPRPDAKVVARLIADLDSDNFSVRQHAMKELGKFGGAVAPALRRALGGKPALEVRRRLQQLLDQSRDWTPERLREHRALQALEHIGTPAARQVLEALAQGAPEARLTEEAKAALRRQ